MTPQDMKTRLESTLKAVKIEVIDLTGTRDHYQVELVSDAFQGLSRIERHKLVMSAFSQELASGEVHALTIKAQTVAEAGH